MSNKLEYDQEVVAAQIYTLRKKILNISQEQMAKELKIHRSTYTKYETGQSKPSMAVLIYICDLYNVSLPWLLTGVGPSSVDTDETIREGFAKQFDIDDITFLRGYTMLPKKLRKLVDPLLSKTLQCALDIFQRRQ